MPPTLVYWGQGTRKDKVIDFNIDSSGKLSVESRQTCHNGHQIGDSWTSGGAKLFPENQRMREMEINR